MNTIKLAKPSLSKKDFIEINKSLKSGWLTHGKKNIEFEKTPTSIPPGDGMGEDQKQRMEQSTR